MPFSVGTMLVIVADEKLNMKEKLDCHILLLLKGTAMWKIFCVISHLLACFASFSSFAAVKGSLFLCFRCGGGGFFKGPSAEQEEEQQLC